MRAKKKKVFYPHCSVDIIFDAPILYLLAQSVSKGQGMIYLSDTLITVLTVAYAID